MEARTKMVTANDVMALEPRYLTERIRRLARGRAGVSLSEVLESKTIPIVERVWLGVNLLSWSAVKSFAGRCRVRAERYAARVAKRAAAGDETAWRVAEFVSGYAINAVDYAAKCASVEEAKAIAADGAASAAAHAAGYASDMSYSAGHRTRSKKGYRAWQKEREQQLEDLIDLAREGKR